MFGDEAFAHWKVYDELRPYSLSHVDKEVSSASCPAYVHVPLIDTVSSTWIHSCLGPLAILRDTFPSNERINVYPTPLFRGAQGS